MIAGQRGSLGVRILVVDDHPLMTMALRTTLKTLDSPAEVESAADLESAFRLAATKPDFHLTLLDLGLPGCSGVEALQRYRERFPELPVVVVSGASDSASIHAALELGAMGFIPKTYPGEAMLNAVRVVVSGKIYVPVEALQGQPAARASVTGLSPRQSEVLSLLLKGMQNKVIARKLDIAENTVKQHVSAVMRALGASTRTQAVLAASRLGVRLDGS